MTFCLGLRCKDGLIGIADTRLTSGDADFVITGKKLFTFTDEKDHAMFIMVSGLKSVSDAVITYLNDRKENLYCCTKMFQGVDFVSKILREVREREEAWLAKGGLEFSIDYIVGGQFPEDKSPRLFRIYSEGSWKRVSKDTPYEIVGEVKYGKAVLDRTFSSELSVERGLMIGLISFDSTRKSNPLVNPPLDIIKYKADSFEFEQKRLENKDLLKIRESWESGIKKVVDDMMTTKYPFLNI
jgi:putative proteasome-type protease